MIDYSVPEKCTFLIEHLAYSQAVNMPEMHSHDYYEIYYQISGLKNYMIEDRFVTLKKGDAVIIAPGTRHKTTHAGIKSYQRFLVYFNPHFIPDFDQLSTMIHIPNSLDKFEIIETGGSEKEKIEQLLFNMLEEYNSQPQNCILNLQLLLKELLVRLDRCKNLTKAENAFSPNLYMVISEVCNYLQTNYKQEIKLKELAELFKFSEFYLSRKFKQITKCSITEYINNIRLEYSKELLKAGKSSITEIASQVGYGSSSQYARVFKKYMGSTPLQYRKLHGSQL